MNWEKLNMSQRSELMSIYLRNGITSLDEMKKHYNSFAEGGSIDDPPYNQFLNTLPDNLKNSGDEYNMRRYWELNGYPKDFNEGIQRGMFTKQDDGYHANSVAFNPITNSYEFMKDRNHPTYNMELDWYYSDDPEAVEFRKKYKYTPGIGMIPDQYTPRRFDTGGPIDPRRFFGIATPEVTDNTIYRPTYGTMLPEVKVVAKGDPRKVNNDYYKAHSRTRANIQDSHARAGLQYLSTVGQGLSALSYFTGLGEAALPIKMGFRGLAEALGKEAARNTPQYIMQLPDVIEDVSDPDAVSILLDSPGRIVSKVDDAIPLGKLSFLKYLDNWIPPVGAAYDAYGALTPEEDKGFSKGGSIHIKPENRGKFTALKERTGHSASWFKENGTPAQKKMAVFELNSRKWRK